MGLGRPLAIFFELRTNPISDVVFSSNPCLAAAISYIILFSDVGDPSEITSKRDLLSMKSCTGSLRSTVGSSSWEILALTSNISLNAITSIAITGCVLLLDLYYLKWIGIIGPLLSRRKQI